MRPDSSLPASRKHRFFVRQSIAGIAAAALILWSFPTAAAASSWSPTLLVNTESFNTIDDGDGSTDIEIRFGDTVNERIYWDVSDSQFWVTDDLHVDVNLTASGTLSIEGAATFGSTIRINGVTYTFPYSDGSATGKVLKTNGAGTLSWSDDNGNFTFADLASWFVNDTGDTMTGALTVNVTGGNPSTIGVSVKNTLSGAIVHARDTLSASGGELVIEGGTSENARLTLDSNSGAVAGDTWDIIAQATGNDLSIQNNATEVLNLTTAGALQVDSNMTIGSAAAATDYTITFDGETTDGILKFFEDESVFQFDSALQVRGPITASGHISADGNLTLNVDQTAANTVLTFGSDGTNETLTFINLEDRFEFSDDLRVTGGLYSSGGLIVEAGQTITAEGVSYTFPRSDGAASGMLLATNGAGQLSWTDGSGSGEIVMLQPEYPGAIYFSSGTTFFGQLSGSGVYSSGATVIENYYHWESTKTANQDYWIGTRVRIPDNFLRWDPVAPIEMRYRTGSGLTTNNSVKLQMMDTADTYVKLTGASELVNTSFTTATITGPNSAGTYTAGSYITLYIKLTASDPTDAGDRGFAEVSFIELNWETGLR